MAKERTLKVCNLHKDGICNTGFKEHKVKTAGLVNGKLCEGEVCEDFEGRYICGSCKIQVV